MSKILAFETWSEGDWVGIRSSDGKIIVSQDVVQLLEFMRYSAKGVVRAFWDLDSGIAPILRKLSVPVLTRLSEHDANLSVGGHELYYLPDRSFRCGRSRYHSIRQFWSSSEPVPSTLEEVQSKADELSATLTDCGMGDFQTLVSPIAVFAETELGKQTYDSIPKGYEIPPSCFQAIEYASKCDKREWVAAHILGGFAEGEIFDYDVNAMYPSVASELLNLREMEFWKSDKLGAREQGAYYGFLRGHLYLDPTAEYIHCSPLITEVKRLPGSIKNIRDDVVLPGNPAGDFGEYYLTLDELRFIERYELGVFMLVDGWFMHPYGGVRPTKPFEKIVDYLYRLRYRSDLAGSIAKNIANQLIGKLIETRVDGDYGRLRNDLYHALILSQARVKVAEFLVQNEITNSELVAVQTDGVRVSRYIPIRSSSGMGQWRCNGSQNTVVASPYRVFVANKKPGSITYDKLVSLIYEQPYSPIYKSEAEQRLTLRQALQIGDISLVGSVDNRPTMLDVRGLERGQNRAFAKLPRTGISLLNGRYYSTPVIL